MNQKAPTLQDVATTAGVSSNTASVVLNGAKSNTRVSEATRQRVLDAAQQLRYHPNAAARSLVHRKTDSIGVIFGVAGSSTDYVTNPYMAGILQGVLKVAGEVGYCVTIFTQPWVNANASAHRFRDGRTDGIIVIASPENSDILEGLSSLGIPLAAVACPGERYSVPTVDVDNRTGIEMAMDHLRELGHYKIALFTGEENMHSTPQRISSYRNRLKDWDCNLPAQWIHTCAYSGAGADAALRKIWQSSERPTAILACNDAIAAGVLAEARSLSIKVPEELSVMGYDDAEIASLQTPPLTTISQPLQQIGELTTHLLLKRLQGVPIEPLTVLLDPKIVVRKSTSVPSEDNQ